MSLGIECCLWAQEPVLNVAPEVALEMAEKAPGSMPVFAVGARLCPVGSFLLLGAAVFSVPCGLFTNTPSLGSPGCRRLCV